MLLALIIDPLIRHYKYSYTNSHQFIFKNHTHLRGTYAKVLFDRHVKLLKIINILKFTLSYLH